MFMKNKRAHFLFRDATQRVKQGVKQGVLHFQSVTFLDVIFFCA